MLVVIQSAGCVVCGKQTKRFKTSGRYAKYCASKCRDLHSRRKEAECSECGKSFIHYAQRLQQHCSISCAQRARQSRKRCEYPQPVCKNCGEQFLPKNRRYNTFCSRSCAFAWKNNRATTQRFAKHVVALSRRLKKCSECGGLFYSRYNATTCGEECRKAIARRVQRERYFVPAAERNEPVSKECRWCGRTFVAVTHVTKRVFCSLACCDAAHKKRHAKLRRARKANNGPHESFDPQEIFERDGYKCYLCGCRTDQSSWPSDMYPTIDHVIPLARGGTHTRNNVRCACFRCNSAKTDSIICG